MAGLDQVGKADLSAGKQVKLYREGDSLKVKIIDVKQNRSVMLDEQESTKLMDALLLWGERLNRAQRMNTQSDMWSGPDSEH